ncbi:shikimate kinase AroK [Halopseudomonas laoshanensis]|uniref:Shikimate kinase n=2 Tax=Halopseudomonas TaxID=2901189 RepID=A0A7V7KU09_9GAMM|nr:MULTISPECIES: shikimate kinase AroK [Halopseudomonas]MBQ0743055.1 shikimate kinase AroK [Pseudomonas sp.]KAA0691823.1 shikimate kinase AroK [Halopseudomonas laoshanensis]MBQ0778297.1 shikimate kinase AroK [Pseudomonas sp.]PCC99086.1 shikimate kinase AroK [Halopseudomonas pelagia]QFY58464.1 shikimate kinase AroK [Halopseudomonas pelagia]
MRNVFLIGPMGAGKSTIGRLLAKELKYPFKDSDREIEARTGADIPWIFDVEGEEGFREREEAMIAELVQEHGIILATGGGVVMREANRRALSANGLVVYLRTSVDQQLQRTSKDRQRPLLLNADPEKVLRDLMARRDPLYSEIADVTIDTDQRGPKIVVNTILSRLQGTDD